jgi:hypothetical protein
MDKNTLMELVPHYIGMLILVFGILGIVQLSIGQVGF